MGSPLSVVEVGESLAARAPLAPVPELQRESGRDRAPAVAIQLLARAECR